MYQMPSYSAESLVVRRGIVLRLRYALVIVFSYDALADR